MNRRRHRSIHLLNFMVHALVGIALFLVVGLPAVFLNMLTRHLSGVGASTFTPGLLTLMEYTMLVFDVIAALVYIGVTTAREVREMLDE